MMASAGDGASYDFVVIGSGAGSVIASLVAKAAGARPLIIEKTDKFGGSTALSGGVIWVPNSPTAARGGAEDTPEDARAYLDACAGPPGPGSSAERRAAFLEEAPKAIAFLEERGMKLKHARGWSDYHEGEKPGGKAAGRALVAEVFDLDELGEWADKLRIGAVIPITVNEAAPIARNGRDFTSLVTMVKVGLRMMVNKLGSRNAGMGVAVQGRLLQLALKAGVDIWLETPVRELIVEDGRVNGVVVERNGQLQQVRASRGVLINAGGFSHRADMREKVHAPAVGQWTHANPGDTGDAIALGEQVGAGLAEMDLAWWLGGSVLPNGYAPFHLSDFAKPYGFVVDSSASRYVNEATSYVQFGLATFERNKTVPAIPAHFIMDSRMLRYRLGSVHNGGKPPREWLDSGYLKTADTIEELAVKCGLDPAALRRTTDRFNSFAEKGVDEDFGRGASTYAHWFGDPNHKPNPNLGRVEKPPFYAIEIVPVDVGTAGGITADERGRVLRADGSVVPGLYACGNSTAPFAGRAYPGAGTSVAAAMVFGYIAAKDALGVN